MKITLTKYFIAGIILILVASCSDASMKSHKIKPNRSGTITVYAESDWYETAGEAENETNDIIESEIADVTSEIESDGGVVAGVTSSSISIEDKTEDEQEYFRGSTQADIEWVEVLIGSKMKFVRKNIDPSEEILKAVRTRIISKCHRLPIPPPAVHLCLWGADSLSNLKILNVNASIDQSQYRPIPDTVMEEKQTFSNCSSTEQTESFKFEMTSERGETLTLKESVENTQKISASIKFKVLNVGGERTRKVTLNKTGQQTHKEVVKRTRSTIRKIPPLKKLVVTAKMLQSSGGWPFKATILIDAVVIGKGATCSNNNRTGCGPSQPMSNGQLSKYLNKEQRTLTVEGYFENAEVSELSMFYIDKDLDRNNPNDCPEPNHIGRDYIK